jgi:hypothetical protein
VGSYFIKIEDGPDVRRKILESSKASIHVLKGYQQLLAIRGQKLSLMNDLRRQLKELTLLLNRADALMPQLTAQELAEFNQRKDVIPRPVPKPIAKPAPKKARDVFVPMPRKQVVTEISLPKEDLPALEDTPAPVKRMSELEKLEDALKRVENQLGNI